MTWAPISAAAFALLGAVAVLAYVRWQWRPRTALAESDRWTIHRDRRGHVHLQAELLAEAVDSLPIGVVIVTASHVVYANRSACASLGRSSTDLRSRPFWEFMHPLDIPKGEKAVQQNKDRDQIQTEHRNRWIAADGTIRHLTWDASTFDRELGWAYCTVKLRTIEPAPVSEEP